MLRKLISKEMIKSEPLTRINSVAGFMFVIASALYPAGCPAVGA